MLLSHHHLYNQKIWQLQYSEASLLQGILLIVTTTIMLKSLKKSDTFTVLNLTNVL